MTNLCKIFYKEYFTFITVFKYHLKKLRDFPGGPVVMTPCFQSRGHEFDPWLGS